MEKVFFVVGDDLEDIDAELASGGRIKAISPVAESVSISAGSRITYNAELTGSVYAYIVIEYPDNQ